MHRLSETYGLSLSLRGSKAVQSEGLKSFYLSLFSQFISTTHT